MGKGGGGQQQQQQPTTSTVQQTNLPAWAQPYSEQLLGKAQALTDINQNPYQAYQGQRLAGFTPMQQQAFQNIQNMQVSPQTGQATGLAGIAGVGSLGAGQNYMNMATDPNAISAYMSPYMQNVVDWQKQQAVMDYSRALPGLGAQASQQGAFGGSRHGLVEAEAQRNLQNQLAGIQATGSQNAFNAAQQAQQFGAGLGLQGYGQALNAAQALGQLGQQQYGQQMGINAALQQAGAQQQALQQQGLTNAYQDYLNQMNYPYQQLAFMSDVLHGTPTGGITTAQTYQAQPSMFSQIAGLGQLGLGLGMLGRGIGIKEGGAVKGYAEGGNVKTSPGIAAAYLTDHMDRVPNPQETFLADNPPAGLSPELLAMIKANQMVVAQERQQNAQTPQTNVKQDIETKLAGLPTLSAPVLDKMGDETAHGAHGGIVAFAGEGSSLVGEAASSVDLDEIQRQRIIAERQAARDAARAAAETAGKPTPVETIGQSDVALDRAKRQAAERLARARAGLGSTPEAMASQAGKTAADLEIEKMLEKGAKTPKPGAAEAPKPGAAAGAAEEAVASAAEKKAAQSGLKSLAGRAGQLAKSGLGRLGVYGLTIPAAEYLQDTPVGQWLQQTAPAQAMQRGMGSVFDYLDKDISEAGKTAAAEVTPAQKTTVRNILDVVPPGKDNYPVDRFRNTVMVESGGKHMQDGELNTNPVSGARGITQLLPKYFPVGGDRRVAAGEYTYLPPQDNSEKEFLRAGYEYKNALYKYYKGDADKTDLAYFKGPTAVDKAIKKAEKEGKPEAWIDNLTSVKGDMAPKDYLAAVKKGMKPIKTIPEKIETAKGAVVPNVEPTVARQAGKVAGAETVIDPKTGKGVLVEPGTNTPVAVPQLGKPAVTAPSPEVKEKANSAFAQAEKAAAAGNKVDADKWFNIGMALLASGSATLGARGAEAQGFGPLAAGIKAGVPVYAELSKQDKAEKLRLQQLAETKRKDLVSEIQRGLQLHQTSMIAKAKQTLPLELQSDPGALEAAVDRETLNYFKSLPAEYKEAYFGKNADAVLAQAERALAPKVASKPDPRFKVEKLGG
jgi:hypothetical protein